MQENMQLPWAQLTHLIFVSETPLEFFYFVVQECPLLERLSMYIDNSNNAPIFRKVITLNNLRHLSFTLLNIKDPFFINTISFPVLENLHFFSSQRFTPPDFSWEPLTSSHWNMLHQLRNLHTLVLGFHTLSGDTLLEILRIIPHLVELAIDSDLGTYRSFLQGLTYQSNPREGHQNILKHLETFRLYMEITGDGRLQPRISDDFALILDAFLVMVLSRTVSQSFPKGAEGTHTAFPEEINVPARLRMVLLRVEDTRESQQTADLDEFHTRCQTHPQLSPPNMLFNVTCKPDEYDWLEEKVDTWETFTHRS
jgi:hypothetical protein